MCERFQAVAQVCSEPFNFPLDSLSVIWSFSPLFSSLLISSPLLFLLLFLASLHLSTSFSLLLHFSLTALLFSFPTLLFPLITLLFLLSTCATQYRTHVKTNTTHTGAHYLVMSARILPGAGRQSRVRRHLSRGLDAAARRDRARVRTRGPQRKPKTLPLPCCFAAAATPWLRPVY